jgi:flagellin
MERRRVPLAFRIGSNVVPIQAARYLTKANQQIEKSLGSLASGSRIVRAGDDAAGFAIAEGLRGQVGGLKQAKFNAESATSLVQTAEGGLNEQNNILVRLRELAVYAASDTIGDEERGYLDNEFQQLTQEFDRIAKSTRYGNKQLLTGTNEQFEFQVGPFQGAENVIKYKLDANTTASDVGIDGLEISDQDSAGSALEDIDGAMTHVAAARAGFGAMQSRFQHAIDALGVQAENLEEARGHIVDVDMAEEVSKLAQAQILQQAGTSVIAQANTSSMRALRLLDA